MGGKSVSGMTPKFLALATGRSKFIGTEKRKTVDEASFRGKQLSFRHTNIETSTRHPSGDD